jgi:hypothetical protein
MKTTTLTSSDSSKIVVGMITPSKSNAIFAEQSTIPDSWHLIAPT